MTCALAPSARIADAANVTGTTIKLVAIGDSITYQGDAMRTGWLSIYASRLETATDRTAHVENFGTPGATSGEILDALRTDDSVRSALQHADLVIYQAGINDFFRARTAYLAGRCGGSDNENCLRTMVMQFKENWDLLVNAVARLAPDAAKRTMNIYYPTIQYDRENGHAGTLRPYLLEMDRHIAANTGGPLVDAHRIYNGTNGEDPAAKGYLLSDGVHPDWLGHLVIANVLSSLGYAEFGGPHPGVITPITSLQSSTQADASRDGGVPGWLVASGVLAAAALLVIAGAWFVTRNRHRGSVR